jgi:rRNA maturation endonuclease Nob1
MMVHMSIDNDIQLEKTCEECKSKAEEEACISCGKKTGGEYINPEFDEELFNQLKNDAS